MVALRCLRALPDRPRHDLRREPHLLLVCAPRQVRRAAREGRRGAGRRPPQGRARAQKGLLHLGRALRSARPRARLRIPSRLLGGRYLFEPGRMAELGRRLESDGIRIARGARGGIQYRYRSKALGRVRKVSGAALGFAANRATGRGRGGSRCAASDSRWHSPSRYPAMSARTAAGAEGAACRSPLRGSAGGRGLRSAGATRERRAVLGFLLRATSKRLGMALAGAPIGAARLPAHRAR